MLVNIENYRGIRAANFQIKGITLIGAINGAGKSSIAQAIAACATGNALPVPGMIKSQAGQLVRSGAAKGFAELLSDDEENRVRVTWPKAEVSTEGPAPLAISDWAAGLASLATMDDKTRSTALTDFLNARPTKEDLLRELAKVKIDAKLGEKLWEMLQEFGWEETERKAREKGKHLKWQWQETTGENYGSKKAENYLPPGFDFDLDTVSVETLEADLTNLRSELEAVIASSAVDFAERQRLETAAARIPDLEARVAEAEKLLEERQAEEASANDTLASHPLPASNPPTVACPHCSGALVIHGNTVRTADDLPSEDDLARLRQAHADAKAARDAARALVQESNSACAALNSALKEARDAAGKLAGMTETGEAGSTDTDIEAAREAVSAAERRLKCFEKKRDADHTHAQIERNQLVIDIVSPGGLRLQVLHKAVCAFIAEYAKPLNDAAGWLPVELDRELMPTYGERIYPMLSESEKFRVRVTLQAAMVKKLGDQLMIVDASDVLDRAGRNGLVKMLAKLQVPAVVCMMLFDKTQLPDMDKAGLGRSYWIEQNKI